MSDWHSAGEWGAGDTTSGADGDGRRDGGGSPGDRKPATVPDPAPTRQATGTRLPPSGYTPPATGGRSSGLEVLLRGEMSRVVLVGGLLVALVIAVAGFAILTRPDTPPTLPFVPLAGVDEVTQPILDVDRDILYVPADDGIHAFPSPDDSIDFCARSGNIESRDGEVWTRTGQPLSASAPLDEHPVIVFDDVIYVNRTTTVPAQGGGGGGASVQPQCGGDGG